MKAATVALLVLLALATSVPLGAAQGQSVQNRQPASLNVAVVPPVLPADSNRYPAMVVSLVDANNVPTISLDDTVVYLSSSNESVAVIPPVVTLLAGHSFLQVGVNTTSFPGSAILAVTGAGLASSSVEVKTVKTVVGAASLSIFVSPSRSIRALGGGDVIYAVQLASAAGKPATSTADTRLVVTSSNSSLVKGPINVTMPVGTDVAYGQLSVSSSGTSTLTALAPQLATGSAQLNVVPLTYKVSLTVSPSNVTAYGETTVLVSVQVLGMPVAGANVSLSVDLGTLVPTSFAADSSGRGVAKYFAQGPGPATILAVASTRGLGRFVGSTTIFVAAQTSTTSSGPASMFLLYIPIIVIAAVAAASYLIVRSTLRRRRNPPEEDYEGPEAGKT